MAKSRVEPVDELLALAPERIDPLEFRGVLGHFATGVAAVTGLDAGDPVGLLVNSFTSVSLDPPLVAFCVAHTSRSWSRLRSGDRHCICFLAADQQEQGLRLASRAVDKFREVPWSPSPSGLPVLDGALAWLECAVEAEHPAGDHVIVVARVHHLAHLGDDSRAEPLLFYRGRWSRLPAA